MKLLSAGDAGQKEGASLPIVSILPPKQLRQQERLQEWEKVGEEHNGMRRLQEEDVGGDSRHGACWILSPFPGAFPSSFHELA